jgi:hypothetical protein
VWLFCPLRAAMAPRNMAFWFLCQMLNNVRDSLPEEIFLRSWENRSLQRAMGQKLRELEGAESEHRTKVGIGGSGAATLNADFLAG